MKLYDIDVQEFLKLLEHAKGNIYLITEDGDSLNLKSKLSQLYGVKMLLETAKNASISAELKFDNTEDQNMFLDYLVYKKVPKD